MIFSQKRDKPSHLSIQCLHESNIAIKRQEKRTGIILLKVDKAAEKQELSKLQRNKIANTTGGGMSLDTGPGMLQLMF